MAYDDDNWCFTATFVHKVGYMGRGMAYDIL